MTGELRDSTGIKGEWFTNRRPIGRPLGRYYWVQRADLGAYRGVIKHSCAPD